MAALLLVAVLTFLLRLVRSVPPLSGREALPVLSSDADVLWDSLGVPHISAASDRDAFAVLGYLHARDRLWQMELLRRSAEGRLAEVLGSSALSADRYLRSLDIPRIAAASLAQVPPRSRAILDAYVSGVNRWVTAHTRPLPPEFLLLRFVPEPWRAEQAFEVARLMSWDLVSSGSELSLAAAASRVGPERVRELFPVYPDSAPVILPPGTGTWSGPHRGPSQRASADDLPSVLLASKEVPRVPPLAAAMLDAASRSQASNSWVVGPSRTRSGKPILANDPHLSLRAPSVWYLVALESPGFTVAGATLPGLPAVVIGRNRRIAWGLTNIEADDVDYVIERLSADSSRVLTNAGWRPVEAVAETIRVRGRSPVPFTLRRTSHGPLVAAPAEGAAAPGEVRALAMRWNAQEPSDELTASLDVDRAGSWSEFLAAVAGFGSPEENWVYADVDGNIGYTASGRIPVRRSGRGLLPTPGWTEEGRWERFLSFAELPRVFNPPQGFIVTANNRVIGPEYPWLLTARWELPHRAARIRELILAHERLSPEDVRRMQMDTLDVYARWAKGLAANAAAAEGRGDLASALRAWDGTEGSDRTEPTLFWAWERALERLTFEDEVAYRPASVFQAWLRAGSSPWFDDVRTAEREDLAALSRRAMRAAIGEAAGRRWGEVHRTVSPHALAAVRPLAALLRLNVGPDPRAGSPYTVNVADFPETAPPFLNTHAASFRQVVDLADPESAGLILTTGQSGNPVSSRYRDAAARWKAGRLWTVPLSRARVAGVGRLQLVRAP